MAQDVFIIGATGRVGKQLVKQIIEKDDTRKYRHANPTRIVGLSSSQDFIYSSKGISKSNTYAFTTKNFSNAQPYRNLDKLLEVARHDRDGTLVFVDVTPAKDAMTQFHLEVIEQTPYGIVTANKNPLTSSYMVFQKLTRYPRRYGYRCSVMAGSEVVPFLQDLKDLNDPLHKIEGCLSGTIGLITSELERNKPFSDILKEAHSKGYTEPHPRDDLSGLDVARKLCILARTAGYPLNLEDVELNPFIPKEYLSEDDVNRFLDSVKALDPEFSKRTRSAEKNDQTLRYVARFDLKERQPKISVSLEAVPKDSELGRLEDTKNKIIITSEAYPDGYSIDAMGAGLHVTARNVRRDLLHLLPERKFVI